MVDLIKELEAKNIKVSLRDNNLEINFDGEMDKDLLIKLKANKEALVNFLSKHANVGKRITSIGYLENYPISHAQKRLWIQSQIEENSKSYHVCNQMQLEGDYDISLFESAVLKVIRRHEILRTVFKLNDDGEVRQWILNDTVLNFKVDYLDFTNEELAFEKAEKYISEDNDRLFDLEKGPLLRVAFLKVAPESYIFYYNMHHIITDGWSLNILEKDLFAYYQAMKQGVECNLEHLPIQYKDYAYWQLSAIESGTYKKHQDFWTQQLSGDLPRLNLPAFTTRPMKVNNNGNILKTFLSADLTHKIKQFSAKNGGSLFMVLVPILKILLHKYTSQKDLIIGTVVAGREDSDLEDQIGFYVNTLVLRNQLDVNDSFSDFFEKVKQSSLEAFSHQIYPFDMLVSDLNLAHDNSRNYIFDIMVNLYNFSNASKELVIDEKMGNEIAGSGHTKTNFDLEIIFDEIGNSISFTTIYKTDIYDELIIKKFMNHFKQLAATIFEKTDVKIDNITYLSEFEKEKILSEFNDTAVVYHEKQDVVTLFEIQADKTPESIAVEFDAVKLSYAELNAHANALGYYLREKYNLQAEDFVGIKLDRSEQLIVSLLAVLKSGSAYIPIDSSYPQDRIDYIERNSNCKLILDAKVLQDFYVVQKKYSQNNFQANFSSINAAYAIYTSGSTGTPKGVVINHSSLTNYLLWARNYYSSKGTRTLDFGLFTSLSFDLTVTSLFLPLISGGLLKVFRTTEDVSELLSHYLESGLKNIKLTPSHIRVIESLNFRTTSIELAIVGGEELLESQVEMLRKLNPGIRIINEYGPTEATVGCMVYDVIGQDILIGKPIANTQVYILDETLSLCGLGLTGELYFSGAGLARGYLNRTDLTEERFVSNPFLTKTLMYKTGDTGRWLPDNNVEYLGRIDDQVKIRGYRIELGDIETSLSKIEGIRQSVVAVKQDDGEAVLVAYYVSDDALDKNDIQFELAQHLPNYMLPSYYIQLDTIPLTTNGKVNRKGLPEVSSEDIIQKEFVAPSTEVEVKLAEIWQKVLGLEKIGTDDNFFAIGGQSIKAIIIVAEIKKEFNVNMNLETIFSNPTIKFLAREINNQDWLNKEFKEGNITDKVII